MFSPRLVTPLVARRQAVRWSTQAVRFFASDAPVVPIREQLKNALKAAMRAKNTHETTIVKSILADIIYHEKSSSPPKPADDAGVYAVIQKSLNQRRESAKQYLAGERKDLGEKEQQEADFIVQFLPTPLTSEEIRSALARLIEEGGISKGDIKSLGKLMKAFWAEVDKVKADGAEVGKVAKELLMGEGPKA